MFENLPAKVQIEITNLKKREADLNKVKSVIRELCKLRSYRLSEISLLLKKHENYVSRKYIKPMIDSSDLKFLYPEMINHPEQAYITNIKD